jgi:hypothetical protein
VVSKVLVAVVAKVLPAMTEPCRSRNEFQIGLHVDWDMELRPKV